MNVTGTLNLAPDATWAQSQTRRKTLNCLTAEAPVIINLPTIEAVNGVSGGAVEIVILDGSGNAVENNITINAGEGNTCNGRDFVSIASNGESVTLLVGNDTEWAVNN